MKPDGPTPPWEKEVRPPAPPGSKLQLGQVGVTSSRPPKTNIALGGCGGRTSFSHVGVGPRILEILAKCTLRELQKRHRLQLWRRQWRASTTMAPGADHDHGDGHDELRTMRCRRRFFFPCQCPSHGYPVTNEAHAAPHIGSVPVRPTQCPPDIASW